MIVTGVAGPILLCDAENVNRHIGGLVPEIQKPIKSITARCSCCGEVVSASVWSLFNSNKLLTLAIQCQEDIPSLMVTIEFAEDAIGNCAQSKENSPVATPTAECTA